MNNPRVGVAIGAIGVVICGAPMIFHGAESASQTVMVMQWFFLAGAAVCLIGSLIRLANES